MMRHYLIRLAVSLVTFAVGLQLAWLVAAFFGPAMTKPEAKGVYAAPAAVRARSCPTRSRLDVPPPPPAPPVVTVEPPTPKLTRVVIRRPDGTVQVIETQRVQK